MVLGRPPLHAAIAADAGFAIARLLVAHAPGAVEQLDADGRSPIMLCLTPPDELGYAVPQRYCELPDFSCCGLAPLGGGPEVAHDGVRLGFARIVASGRDASILFVGVV